VSDEYTQSLEIMFNTVAGKKILKYWKTHILDSSCLRATPYESYYAMGEQDFIKNMIQKLEDPSSLDEVEIET
jgi:hypothetical protein